MTIRLLSTYRQFKPNTNVTLASGTETALVTGGNATTDLSGGVPYDYKLPLNTRENGIAYAPDGVPLGIADSTGKIIGPFSGIAAPGAPTGLALTAIAGGVLATMTAPASNGGTGVIGYEVTLSTGQVQIGENTTITVNAPAGVAVTATAKAINGFDKSAASSASASATPTAFVTPARPGAPTGLTLTAGNGKVTATWTAAAANGSAIRDTIVTLSNGASAVALGSATTVDVITPNGLAVTATARANNGEGAGPVSGVSNSVTPVAAAPRPLMSVAVNNRPMATGAQTVNASGSHVNRTALCIFTQKTIGSGIVDSLVVSLSNILSTLGASSTITVNSIYINNAGVTISAPVPGDYPFVLTNGTIDKQSAEFSPSLIGLAELAQGTDVWLRVDCTLPAGAQMPTCADQTPVPGGTTSQSVMFSIYDPSVTTLSPPTTPGRPTVASGAALPVTTGGYWGPQLLGRFKAGQTPKVPVINADSNAAGPDDPTVHRWGKGSGQYMLRGNDNPNQVLAGINMSVTGITVQSINANPAFAYFHKYGNISVLQAAGNSLGTTGNVTAATVLGYKATERANVLAVNPTTKLVNVRLGPHTVPASGFTLANFGTLVDQSDQDLLAGYQVDGPADQYMAGMDALVGAPGGYAAQIIQTLWRSGANARKWVANGTYGTYMTDGTHGTTLVEVSKGADSRAVVDALSVA